MVQHLPTVAAARIVAVLVALVADLAAAQQPVAPFKPPAPLNPTQITDLPAVLVIEGQVLTPDGRGVDGAEINWVADPPPPPAGESGGIRLPPLIGPRSEPPLCVFHPSIYERRPLAVSRPDGGYTIELPTVGESQACLELVNRVDLKFFPAMVASKAGYLIDTRAPKPEERALFAPPTGPKQEK